MKSFDKKHLKALCLAILVHIAVFIVFYLTVHTHDSAKVADSSSNTVFPSRINITDPDIPPFKSKTYISTLSSTQTIAKKDSDVQNGHTKTSTKNSEAPDEPKTDNTAILEGSQKIIHKDSAASVSVSQNTQEKDAPDSQSNENLMPIKKEDLAELKDIKNHAGLLEMDIPNTKNNIVIDDEHLSIKSEVEEINNQLSQAINEIKNLNQQKINEIEKQKN
ncbi:MULTISPECIES: hypothetical protein [Psychrobacter]|uniref:Uncharacterized protein n=1 Tax=Psychrobacter halodurans TaxID=2818439 RepID=A0AAW4ISR1_9GAMM|nr:MULTISPECIES: hypothetical protein [Psychrobacter]MBO1517811.1 hypothetical protein [Psychrobacter halodurans]OLF41345.1 hypothetical protein BTV99_04680 [Psychrobacter sp. Rd 27.2]